MVTLNSTFRLTYRNIHDFHQKLSKVLRTTKHIIGHIGDGLLRVK